MEYSSQSQKRQKRIKLTASPKTAYTVHFHTSSSYMMYPLWFAILPAPFLCPFYSFCAGFNDCYSRNRLMIHARLQVPDLPTREQTIVTIKNLITSENPFQLHFSPWIGCFNKHRMGIQFKTLRRFQITPIKIRFVCINRTHQTFERLLKL